MAVSSEKLTPELFKQQYGKYISVSNGPDFWVFFVYLPVSCCLVLDKSRHSVFPHPAQYNGYGVVTEQFTGIFLRINLCLSQAL